VPDHLDKQLLEPLAALIKANGKLNDALDATRSLWAGEPPACWIDQLNEPTQLLRKHRVRAKA
jgi:hypothetical protein